MDAIVAVDRNWAIGCRGQLLIHIREDLKRFRQMSDGRILLYGRKTLESFPNGRPLPKRRNLILSQTLDPNLFEDGQAEIYPELAAAIRAIAPEEISRLLLIGGASLFKELLPFCRQIYVTKIDHVFPAADAYFPDLDTSPDWTIVNSSENRIDPESGLAFCYCDYVNRNPLDLQTLVE